MGRNGTQRTYEQFCDDDAVLQKMALNLFPFVREIIYRQDLRTHSVITSAQYCVNGKVMKNMGGMEKRKYEF